MFTIVINGLIIANTIVLAMDKYPIEVKITTRLETCNEFFTFCFVVEMIIKMLGLGMKNYARDRFNIFDAVIVIASVTEFTLD